MMSCYQCRTKNARRIQTIQQCKVPPPTHYYPQVGLQTIALNDFNSIKYNYGQAKPIISLFPWKPHYSKCSIEKANVTRAHWPPSHLYSWQAPGSADSFPSWYWNWKLGCFFPAWTHRRQEKQFSSVPCDSAQNACRADKQERSITRYTDTKNTMRCNTKEHLLMHHIPNPLLDLGESHRFIAVVEHSNNGVCTSKHLSQELVLVR